LRVAEAERKELEKKRHKINYFDEHSMGESIIRPQPAAFAMNKLKNIKYVEIYF
jgi:hypothetical protein